MLRSRAESIRGLRVEARTSLLRTGRMTLKRPEDFAASASLETPAPPPR